MMRAKVDEKNELAAAVRGTAERDAYKHAKKAADDGRYAFDSEGDMYECTDY
jgi:hypothetical protein